MGYGTGVHTFKTPLWATARERKYKRIETGERRNFIVDVSLDERRDGGLGEGRELSSL
jgi:hypothetical protein